MSDEALKKFSANQAGFSQLIDKQIELLAGKRLKFTLLIFSDDVKGRGQTRAFNYTVINSLPPEIVAEALKKAAVNYDAKRAHNRATRLATEAGADPKRKMN